MPSLSPRVTAGVRRAATRVGLERPLLRAYEWRYPAARRDRIDNERLRQLLAFTLSPDSNCIDVGCHRGEVLREMVRLAPRGRHIAYEPVPASFDALAAEFPDVDLRQAALSDAAGESTFTYVVDEPSFSGLRRRDYAGERRLEELTVRTERLDDALPEGYVPRFMKVDVEGAEQLVFEGALETLRRHRPTVFFEHGQGASDYYGTRPADVYRLLVEEAGLRIFDADGAGPYSEADFEAVFSAPMWNFIAHA
jgi:FkbM family methyltransferase